jgi:hypothetical protein
MQPRSIIESFKVIEDGQRDFSVAVPTLTVQQLSLERAEEGLHGGVIIAIAPAAHAAEEVVGFEQVSVVAAGVLNAPI